MASTTTRGIFRPAALEAHNLVSAHIERFGQLSLGQPEALAQRAEFGPGHGGAYSSPGTKSPLLTSRSRPFSML